MQMREAVYLILSICLISSLFESCKKEDTTAPIITLLGLDTVTQYLPTTLNGAIYTDPGALAEDNEDGNMTPFIQVSNPVNANRKGVYTITYSVTDEAGNTTTKDRVVIIANSMEKFAGTYPNSVDSCGVSNNPFIPTVTTSDTIDRLIWISNFGNYGANIKVRATLSDTNIAVPLMQYLNTPMTTFISNVFFPVTDILSAGAPTSLRIKYEWNNGATTDTCSSWFIR